jgi:hypothetical protein
MLGAIPPLPPTLMEPYLNSTGTILNSPSKNIILGFTFQIYLFTTLQSSELYSNPRNVTNVFH